MKKKKKYDRDNDKDYIKFKKQINDNNNDIWTPYGNKYNDIPNDTWFDIKKQVSLKNKSVNINLNIPETKIPTDLYKSIKVELKLTVEQQTIMQQWMKAYIHMYNKTIHYIKNQDQNNLITSFKTLRTYHLKATRNSLIEGSQCINISKDTRIKTHIMDDAIKLACANYKSAITNLKRKHIKHFRIRYWRFNKSYNILDIEKCYFTNNSICPKIFGTIKGIYNNEPFNLDLINTKYDCSCKILYERYSNRYYLLVPQIVEQIDTLKTQKIIALDPGIRTFMTGLSENEAIKICTNGTEKIKPILEYLDKINNLKFDKAIKNCKYKKITKRCYKRIDNLIKELHWKTINYLTNHYKIILIGDLSIKRVINNETSLLSNMTKRVGSFLSFYKFKQRLQYKCNIKGCKYSEVNERWTSALCSCCGNYYNETLAGSKIYKCPKCKTIIDRDINGCRGIYLKMTK